MIGVFLLKSTSYLALISCSILNIMMLYNKVKTCTILAVIGKNSLIDEKRS